MDDLPILELENGSLARRCEFCGAPARSYALPGPFPVPAWLWACPACWRDASRPLRQTLRLEFDLTDD